MAGPGTTFSGPLISGPKKDADASGPANTGLAVLSQTLTLLQNGASAVSGTFVLPQNSQILDFLIDTTTAWNSTGTDTLTIGQSAAATEYVGGVSVKSTGRGAPTYTAAQLGNMASIGAHTSVVATVTPADAVTTGATRVTIRYVQVVDLTDGTA